MMHNSTRVCGSNLLSGQSDSSIPHQPPGAIQIKQRVHVCQEITHKYLEVGEHRPGPFLEHKGKGRSGKDTNNLYRRFNAITTI